MPFSTSQLPERLLPLALIVGVELTACGTQSREASYAPNFEYSGDLASVLEVTNCRVEGDYLVDCDFRNKAPNLRIKSLALLAVYFDEKGVKLGDRMVPDTDIDPGQTARSRLAAYDKISEISKVQLLIR